MRIKMVKKTALLTLVACFLTAQCHAMHLQKLVAWQSDSKKVPTLGDFAAHKLIEELLTMSTQEITSCLSKISPFCQELLKKVLDKYYPCEPKVQQIKDFGRIKTINIALF